MRRTLTSREIQITRAVAAAADLLQFAIFPVMVPGLLSPLNVAVDLLMAAFFTWRLGWHWALLPTFVSELIPFWDLAPTWTVAVFLATRGREGPEGGQVIDTTAVEIVEEEPRRISPRRKAPSPPDEPSGEP